MREELLNSPEGVLCLPDGDPRGSLLVLGGSSGRIQTERCRVLADHGYAALSPRWFADPVESPLDALVPHLDRLAELAGGRVGVVGTSFGALAALLLGAVVPDRLAVVVALAPSDVIWAAPVLTDEGRPVDRSCVSWAGAPVPHLTPVDQTTWTGRPIETPLDLYEVSEAELAPLPTTATNALGPIVPAERITATLVLAAGGEDSVWPSAASARRMADRRAAFGLGTTLCIEPEAGHRIILPGEPPAPPTQGYGYGGTEEADARLGERVLAALLASLRSPRE